MWLGYIYRYTLQRLLSVHAPVYKQLFYVYDSGIIYWLCRPKCNFEDLFFDVGVHIL